MPEVTEDPTKRRHLVPVAVFTVEGVPDGIHLSVNEWVPRFEEWATGLALCGESAEQGALPAGTPVTCQGCEGYRDGYERALSGRPTALYFCPVSREVESATGGGFATCCDRPQEHLAMPDTAATSVVSEALGEALKAEFRFKQQLAALESGEAFPLPVRPDGTHFYVSTYCLHGDHAACRLACLCCGQPCQCAGCGHKQPNMACSGEEGFCDVHGFHRHPADALPVMAVELMHAPTTPDGPTITAGFDPGIEIPELDAQGLPLRAPATQVSAEGTPVSFRDRLLAKHPVTLAELDADPDPASRPNAEDCPQCTDPNPPYPWICPGHPAVAGPATGAGLSGSIADIPPTSRNAADIDGAGQ